MAVNYEFNAEKREQKGTASARRLRRQMKVPAVLYGGHVDPAMLSLDHQEIEKKLLDEGYFSHVLSINVAGEKPQQAIMKAMHRHPSKPRILHIDFMRVSADEKLKVSVPLHFLNEDACVGVKTGGGSVLHNITELEIICLPANLPEFIEVDVSALEIGDALHMTQLNIPDDVEVVALTHGDDHDHDQIVVSVQPPRVEEVEVVEDEVDESTAEDAAADEDESDE
ncbi:MAG: 50S ribosomal protein L25/general stress protein Ctc [Methylococcales bacterium]